MTDSPHKTKVETKPKRAWKPVSELQHLSRQTQWTINYRLHRLPTRLISSLHLTVSAQRALDRYNSAVGELKKELNKSYRFNRSLILRERERNEVYAKSNFKQD